MHHRDIGLLKNCNTPKTWRHFFNCAVFYANVQENGYQLPMVTLPPQS